MTTSSIRPKKRFGQNFLRDQNVIRSILALVKPCQEDNVLEIGPGTGVLTKGLIQSGAVINAVEIDRNLCRLLSEKFQNNTNFILHQCDILQFDLKELKKASKPWKVVGNLPYNIATKILIDLLSHPSLFTKMVIMTQLEVAEKIVAAPHTSNYGRLSIALQRKARVNIKLKLGKECFFPEPKVNSAVLEIRPKAKKIRNDFEIKFSDLTRSAFNNRRKAISNSLKDFFSSDELLSLGLNPKDRAQNLSIETYEKLTNFLMLRERKEFGP